MEKEAPVFVSSLVPGDRVVKKEEMGQASG